MHMRNYDDYDKQVFLTLHEARTSPSTIDILKVYVNTFIYYCQRSMIMLGTLSWQLCKPYLQPPKTPLFTMVPSSPLISLINGTF